MANSDISGSHRPARITVTKYDEDVAISHLAQTCVPAILRALGRWREFVNPDVEQTFAEQRDCFKLLLQFAPCLRKTGPPTGKKSRQRDDSITLTRCGISPPQREDEACHLHVTLYRTTIETISKSCGQHRHHHEKHRGEQRQCERPRVLQAIGKLRERFDLSGLPKRHRSSAGSGRVSRGHRSPAC